MEGDRSHIYLIRQQDTTSSNPYDKILALVIVTQIGFDLLAPPKGQEEWKKLIEEVDLCALTSNSILRY